MTSHMCGKNHVESIREGLRCLMFKLHDIIINDKITSCNIYIGMKPATELSREFSNIFKFELVECPETF